MHSTRMEEGGQEVVTRGSVAHVVENHDTQYLLSYSHSNRSVASCSCVKQMNDAEQLNHTVARCLSFIHNCDHTQAWAQPSD
jgi:hypothetical protein